MKYKKQIKLVLGNILVLSFILLILELYCRLFINGINLSGTTSNIFIDNRYETSQGFLPNTNGISFGQPINIDSHGFIRSVCSEIEKDKSNILFIGDSVTQGVGVHPDSSFVAKLACFYNDSINIINTALIGYNTSDYTNVVETILSEQKFDFDKIIINYCLNDIYDGNTKGIRPTSKTALGQSLNFLKGNSFFYTWLKNKVLDRKKAYYNYDSLLYYDSEKLNTLSLNFKKIAAICSSNTVELTVIVHPYEYQLRNISKQLTFPQDTLKEIFNDFNIVTQDSRGFFINTNEESKKYYLYGDGIHFSNRGHSVIYDFFLDKHIIE